MPDSVDVSPAIAQEMVDAGPVRAVRRRPSIDEIPEGLKDADNNWTAAYYGIMAIIDQHHDRRRTRRRRSPT